MKNLLNLSDIHSYFHSVGLSSLPSEITIKRWAASGKLDAAKVMVPGKKKPQYDAAICATILTQAINPQQEGRVEPLLKPAPSPDLKVLMDELLEKHSQRTEQRITSAMAQLDDVRKFLMVRYANEVDLLKARNELLVEENKKLKAASTDQSKISIQLSRILDRLSELE